MKTTKLHSVLKILFIVFCALFMLSACGMDMEGSSVIPKASERGESAEQLANEHRQCWQAGLLRVFYTSISAQTVTIYSALTQENLMGIMMLAFSIWMAFKILSHVSTPSPESMGEFWTMVLQKAFLCLLCGMLASSKGQLLYALNSFIFPIYITILDFASEILQVLNTQNPDLSVAGIKLNADDGTSMCLPFDHSIADNGCKITNPEAIMFTEKSGMPDAPLKMMECLACSVSDRLNIGYNISWHLLQMSTLVSFIAGVALLAAFTISQLVFVLYLIDSIFRLNMILIIFPFLVMAYPFEQTRKWSITGFKIILNSSLIMLCLVIMVVMVILALSNILMTGKQKGFDFGLISAYEDFGVVPMALIFTAFLVVKSSGTAVSMAGRIVGEGGDTPFQRHVQQLVGTIAQFGLAAISGGASRGFRSLMDKVVSKSPALQKMQSKLSQIKNIKDRLAGRVEPKDEKSK